MGRAAGQPGGWGWVLTPRLCPAVQAGVQGSRAVRDRLDRAAVTSPVWD